MEKTKNIWVLPEINSRDKEVSTTSLGLLAEARNIAEKTGGIVTALIFSESTRVTPDLLGNYGIPRAYLFLDPVFEQFSVEAYAAAILPRLRVDQPWLLLMGQTAIGRELAPHLAAMLETGVVTSCVKIDLAEPEKPVFSRPVYGGRGFPEVRF